VVAPSDYDQAIATQKQNEAQVKMRRADLEKATVDLEHCTIYSPIAGIVICKNIDVGQTVAATSLSISPLTLTRIARFTELSPRFEIQQLVRITL